MCNQGKNLKCINSYYAKNIMAKDLPGIPKNIRTREQNIWN
jgi:hypothetical protein